MARFWQDQFSSVSTFYNHQCTRLGWWDWSGGSQTHLQIIYPLRWPANKMQA